MEIGIPEETPDGESRVAVTSETAQKPGSGPRRHSPSARERC